jgi:serine/threonine-protein kinase
LLAGRYRLDESLASGGMAQVWRGTDEVLRRAVAIKILHPHLSADETFVARFRQEAIAVAKLSHPAIVSVYDTCNQDGVEAIVMELVTGSTLRHRLDAGPIEPQIAANIGTQVAGALEVAHAAGLVHRDIKPANILLSEDGRVKVGDFGIAKAAESSTDLTQEGSFVGTAKYLAPEQVEGKPVDGRTDLYSLGIVLYEMLCGRPPFEADGTSATALARLHSDPTPVRQVRAEVPVELEGVTLKLLARDPDHRYPNAHQLRTALLQAGADGGIHTTASHTTVSPLPASQRLAAAQPSLGLRTGQAPGTGQLPPPSDHTEVRLGEDEPERNWLVPTLLILLTAVSLAIAGVLIGRSGGGIGDDDDADPPAEDEEQVVEDPGEPLALGPFTAFDPAVDGGDGNEHPEELPLINNGNADEVWRTELYNEADIVGDQKPGVGFYVELDEAATIDKVEITSPSVDYDVEIVVADEPGEGRDDWGEAQGHSAGTDPGLTEIELEEPTEGRYVLVYFTKASSQREDEGTVANNAGQTRFSVAVSDVEVFGS